MFERYWLPYAVLSTKNKKPIFDQWPMGLRDEVRYPEQFISIALGHILNPMEVLYCQGMRVICLYPSAAPAYMKYKFMLGCYK